MENQREASVDLRSRKQRIWTIWRQTGEEENNQLTVTASCGTENHDHSVKVGLWVTDDP